MNDKKQNFIIKIVLFILTIFLVIEIIPVFIGIIKLTQGDSKAWSYIVIPSLSIISTTIIIIPAFFISRATYKNEDDETLDDKPKEEK